ncbi:MAG: S49 family peptidase, partial [Candidatus Nealsonbacteria bacterium]|nr:S49 family peptidase [Candidatus Nealsonbacteria bacterium]
GSLSKPIEGEQLEVFEKLIDDGFTQFKDVIKSGRPRFDKDPFALDELATGQIYTANQAKENGLIDKIGFIEEAIERAIELAKLDPSDVKVVEYGREPTLASVFLGARSQQSSPELAALLEMTVPRAYYLCTWLPGLTK